MKMRLSLQLTLITSKNNYWCHGIVSAFNMLAGSLPSTCFFNLKDATIDKKYTLDRLSLPQKSL